MLSNNLLFRHLYPIIRTFLAVFVGLFFFSAAAAQSTLDEEPLSPVRPTVSDSAKIQKKGIVQIEYGGDFDFRSSEFRNRQTAPLGVYFALNNRLRLDFEADTVISEKNRAGERKSGFGDIQLGFKAIARQNPEKHLAVAFVYAVKLPTASPEKNLGTGKFDHNLRLVLHREIGKTEYIFNAAYLNNARTERGGRESGAQTVLTVERELSKKFDVMGEVYGNTIEESQPRGLYAASALIYKISKLLYLDVGARSGFGREVPHIGIFAGLTVGIAH